MLGGGTNATSPLKRKARFEEVASGPAAGTAVKRRALLLGGTAAGLLAQAGAFAKAGRAYRVGVLLPMAGLAGKPYVEAIRRRLAAQGLVEGRNLHLDVQFAGGPWADATNLVRSKPDAILVCTTILTQSVQAAAGATPIVFAWVADPVYSKIVPSYSRPGGSVTGVANRFFELADKRLELLQELLPSARRVGVVAGVFDAALQVVLERLDALAPRLGLELMRREAGGGWTVTLEQLTAAGADAIMVLTPFSIFGMRWVAEEVVQFARERRIPVVYSDLESVELGGLISYGNDLTGDLRQAADLLGRVLKGETPGDIPIEQAARFELAVDLKTARAIGIEVPRSILLRADRVIE